jgi:hypothetical protein
MKNDINSESLSLKFAQEAQKVLFLEYVVVCSFYFRKLMLCVYIEDVFP